MRKILLSNGEFEVKLNRLEAKYEIHDRDLKAVFGAIRKLMSVQAGFPETHYRTRQERGHMSLISNASTARMSK